MKLTIFVLIGALAHAGLWARFCEGLVADDPYQYESAPDAWVWKRLNALRIKEAWGKLSRDDASHLKILEREVKLRAAIERLNHAGCEERCEDEKRVRVK